MPTPRPGGAISTTGPEAPAVSASSDTVVAPALQGPAVDPGGSAAPGGPGGLARTTVGDAYCRVTVVGGRKRADLALPARAPVYEYASQLAALVELPEDGLLPPAWSLAPVGRRALPLESSLAAAGIVDGEVLHLRDLLAGEADEAVVFDLDEEVTEAAARFGTQPWNRANRAVALMGVAAGWLLAVGVLLTAALPRSQALLPGLLLLGCAVTAGGIAFVARRAAWPVPVALRVLTALVAVPDAAFAAARLAGPNATGSALALDAAIGAAVATLTVLLAVPGIMSTALCFGGVLVVAVTAVLGDLGASLQQVSAFVAAAGLGIGSLVPWAVDRFVAYSMDERRLGEADSDTIARLVLTAQRLQTTVNWIVGALLAGCVTVLAGSGEDYALGLAGAVSLALILRADGYQLCADALPAVLVGSAGLLALAFELPGVLGAGRSTGPVVVTAVGLLLMAAVVWKAARGDRTEPARPGWHAVAESLLSTIAVPLAVGVFGVYTHLVSMGHGM